MNETNILFLLVGVLLPNNMLIWFVHYSKRQLKKLHTKKKRLIRSIKLALKE